MQNAVTALQQIAACTWILSFKSSARMVVYFIFVFKWNLL
jgi:hypothetical protein